MDFLERHMKSFLWTFVRDPKRRAMSSVGSKLSNQLIQSNKTFFYASNETNNDRLVNSALHLLHNDTDIRDGILSEGRGGFQLQFLMQDYIPHNVVNKPLRPTKIDRYEVAHFVKSVSLICLHPAPTSRLTYSGPSHFDLPGNFCMNDVPNVVDNE